MIFNIKKIIVSVSVCVFIITTALSVFFINKNKDISNDIRECQHGHHTRFNLSCVYHNVSTDHDANIYKIKNLLASIYKIDKNKKTIKQI